MASIPIVPSNGPEQLDERHVADLVAEDPRRAAVFERLGIDYCCGGAVPLAQVCREQGLDPALVRELLAEATATSAEMRDWSAASVAELVENIVGGHHRYLRSELPRLTLLAHKVARVHGDRDARLRDAEQVVTQLVDELRAHTVAEEEEVFPACMRVAEGDFDVDETPQLATALGGLVEEHTEAAGHLERLRELTDGYAPPAGACTSWRAYLDALERLEQDMHRHVHKENHVLFPKVMDALYASGAER